MGRDSESDPEDEELRDIDQVELSLTRAPAVREKFIMVKREQIRQAKWTSAFVNDLPDSSFAYVEPGTKDGEGKTTPREKRHLPYKDENGKVDPPHVRNALARLSKTGISTAAKAQARRKLVAAAKGAKIEVSEEEREELRTEFEKLDADALFEVFLKAKAAPDEEEEEEEENGKPKKPKKVPPEFNFEKVDETAKAALRAVAEALTNITELPEPVAEFAKSIKAKLPAPPRNGNKQTPEELVAFAKSAFPGLVEAIQTPLQGQLDTVKQTADGLLAEKELAEMRKVAEELPGDPDITAPRLLSIKKSLSEEEFEKFIEEQKGLKAEVSKSALMARVSSSQSAPGSAEAIVLAKAQAIVEKSQHGIKTMNEAIDFVGKSDPLLWGRYQEEVRNRPASVRAA